MHVKMDRRSLLSGLAAGLGVAVLDTALAHASSVRETLDRSTPRADQIANLAVEFSPSGLMGETQGDQEYFEQLLKAAIVPPLSDVVIYAHGWLTDVNHPILIYDTLVQGSSAILRDLRRARRWPSPRPLWRSPRTGPLDTATIWEGRRR